MAAGGDNYISFLLVEHTLVFGLNYGCADSSLLNVKEAELLERAAHRFDTHTLIVCNEGWSKAYNNGGSALKKYASLFRSVNYLLCILRANNEAMTAKDAFVADDVCLISRKANSLNGTVADTFVAIFAV